MIGKIVSHYRIVEELGRGGMGVVYKAEDTRLKRTVALKFLPPEVGGAERARFEQEAQSAAHLQHPNICTIHEINEYEGQPYIAMAYIDGVELKALTAKGPMDISEAVSVATQVAMALEEAHEHDIVHRDIKSANVMINRKGLAKVMDFGLAKRRGRTQITVAGTSMGTIDYMSPEQTRGDALDHRTDVWSFGVVLYEMIAGEMPFKGEFDQAVIYSILNEDLRPLAEIRSDVPALLSEVAAKAMAKKPDDRYQSMADLLADLHEVQAEVGSPVGTSVTGAINWAAAGRPSTGGRSAAARRQSDMTPSDGISSATVDARAFQIVGGYAVLAALVIIALHWLVNRFPVSPNLPGFGMWALLTLLPTVALLAFFRGAHRVRMVGLPVTVLAAAALLFAMFGDKDLGAATRTITVTDEAGNEIERVIPKSEFRKRVALFYFDNVGGNDADDWLCYGIGHMLRMDLSQDTYVNVGLGFTRPHKDAGFDVPVGSPTMFKRKLANDYHYPRFITGSFSRSAGQVQIEFAVHRASDGAAVSEHTYTGSDVFALVDSVSVEIRHDLGIPDYHIAESVDIAVSDMFTGSLDAMEDFITGVNARWQDNDYERAIEHLTRAVDKDPAFAVAHQELFGAYINSNQGEQARAAAQAALQHRYKLPERSRFALMNFYHSLQEDPDAMYLNAQRWVSLYPDDVDAHVTLAEYYQQRANDVPAAIAERKRVLEISPERYAEYHNIAELYESIGDFENAELYLNKYAELFPDKYDSYAQLGSFYRDRGDFDRARENYRQALVIDPDRMFIRTHLADIERRSGNFDESLRQCTAALAAARNAPDSTTALRQLSQLYAFRGQAQRALEYQEAMFESEAKHQTPLQVSVNRLFTLNTYVEAGEPERALAIARQMEERPAVPWFKSFVAAGYIITYSFMDDPANAGELDRYLESFSNWVDQAGMHQLDWVVHFCGSISQHWRGDNEAALASARQAIEIAPVTDTENLVWMNTAAGEYARELGQYAEAEEFLNEALTIEPWSPAVHYQLALLYHEQGNIEKAREHIEKTMKVWENADPGHREANEARKLAELLRSSS